MNRYIYLIFILLVTYSPHISAQYKLHGVVRDSATNETLPFAAVVIEGTQTGKSTDMDGMFTINSAPENAVLIVSYTGYFPKRVVVDPANRENIEVRLASSVKELDEVVITPKKTKYSRKNNPAVDLVKKIIEQKKQNRLEDHDFYQYERYEKMTFALNDFSEEQKKKWLFKKFQFIFDYVDTSEISGKPILTVSIREQIENNYYRKNPESKKQVITGMKKAGIDEMLNQDGVKQFLGEAFKEVDIYENDISLLMNRFVSPLSNIATSFYKFYIYDTLEIEGQKCADLVFVPFNSESFGFVGRMYVTLDSTYFVKKVKMNVPYDINLNFVEQMSIEQDFERLPDGTRLITKDDITVEFRLISNTQGLYARRINTYRKYNFDPPQDMGIFKEKERIIIEDDAEMKPEEFWVDNRHVPVRTKENAVEKMLTRLREVPVFYYTEKVISTLISGYVSTSKENSKFDIGPMNTTISGNTAEGARFRIGGLTTANLHPNWFGRGYLAYGTKDKKFKYMGELEYSFNKKRYHTREFPIHSIRAMHSYDINQLGQHYLYTNKDNVFLSLKRKSDTRITYERLSELEYKNEFSSGFSYAFNFNYRTEYPSKWVKFIEEGIEQKEFSVAAAEIKLRYAPNERYYQTKSSRIPITKDAPIFTLSHKIGAKGVLNSKYNINHTELGIQKRFWFSAFGYTDIILKGGKVWSKVPFPLLILPNANLSYTIQPESYTLMNAMEFINDQYLSWDLTYFVNGALFNRIPLLKYLKWREVLSFRGLYGSLSNKNNPYINPKGLYEFPQGSMIMDNMPYMEAGVGIENIFKILRVDYVWRLTYRDLPDIDRSGVRIALHFTF